MMKYFKLLPMAVIVVLMLVMVGCTTIRDASDEYGDAPQRGRRVYYENPYYGNTIILERDPYTGQLYQLSPYGNSPFGSNGYNHYPYGYNRGSYDRGSGYRSRPAQPRTEKPAPNRQNFEDARSKVLGGKKQ